MVAAGEGVRAGGGEGPRGSAGAATPRAAPLAGTLRGVQPRGATDCPPAPRPSARGVPLSAAIGAPPSAQGVPFAEAPRGAPPPSLSPARRGHPPASGGYRSCLGGAPGAGMPRPSDSFAAPFPHAPMSAAPPPPVGHPPAYGGGYAGRGALPPQPYPRRRSGPHLARRRRALPLPPLSRTVSRIALALPLTPPATRSPHLPCRRHAPRRRGLLRS